MDDSHSDYFKFLEDFDFESLKEVRGRAYSCEADLPPLDEPDFGE